MNKNYRELGQVKLVQVQPNGIIIETPSGYIYDASRRVEVECLVINKRGIEADTPAGEHVLDIHHLDHPKKAYNDDDLVCIGFTSHYKAMRNRFGNHMADGIAGENIIIEYEKEVWPDDLGRQITIQNQDNGIKSLLDFVSFAPPCEEFSRFAAQSLYEKLPAEELKKILQFLGNGRRGYLFVLNEKQEQVLVRPGDKVFVVGTG
jgi:hypothetical protein